MQLEQLPKAEKFFKQIVDEKVQQYIESSQKIANQFIKQKQQAQINSQPSFSSIQEVKRQINVLKAILITKVQVPGNSLSEIQFLIKRYEEVLKSYQKSSFLKIKNKQSHQKQNLKKQQKFITSNSQESQNFQQNSFVFSIQQENNKQNRKINKFFSKEKISLILKSTQFLVFTLMMIAFVKVVLLS